MRETFEAQIQYLLDATPQIVAAVAALVVFVIIGKFVSSGASKILNSQRSKAVKQTRLIKRLIKWAFNLIGLIIALNLVGLTDVAYSFLAAGGMMAVILGFAFREIGENLLAGFFLSFSRSFDVGDLIESNDIRGIVQRIEIREVHIRTANGCDIFIPSATIYKNPLFNYTRDGLRRGEFTIGIDFGDDPQAARELMLNTIMDNQFVLKKPKAEVHISGFTPSYVELTAYFWINTFEQQPELAEVKSQVMKECRQALLDHNYTYSSNVTTAVDMLPVQVSLESNK
ncbi:mechanosensitive ion channel family protein [Gracilimonas sp.]|uniref:mechanosensitive ion channel family protein n=1 Tax=Gracilimonas sp. TaxID=1974203 RepID=UPI002872385A|nr:mechanosensitive ion channel family protein [Gracilimonas sp.]